MSKFNNLIGKLFDHVAWSKIYLKLNIVQFENLPYTKKLNHLS